MHLSNIDFITNLFLSPRFRVIRHVCLQGLLLLSSLDVFLEANLPESGLDITWSRIIGSVGYYLILNATIYFNLYVLVPRYLMHEKFIRYLVSLGVLTVTCMVLVILLQLIYFPNEKYEIHSNFPEWFQSLSMVLNTFSSILTIGLLIAGTSAIILIRCWMMNSLRIEELQSNTLQSELKYLRNQINPHFLFNMINNVNVLIKRNPKEASKVLFKLEDLLRYQISDSSKEEVSLLSEIRFLSDFLNLEKIRRDKFEYTLLKEGNIDNLRLPPLLFIPFVENAVKYSFDGENLSKVSVFFSVWDNQLEFRCENTLPEIEVKNKVGGLGLVNIKRRLNLIYPDKHDLKIEKTKDKYIVKLRIKL